MNPLNQEQMDWVKRIVREYVAAVGPVSLAAIRCEVAEQCPPPLPQTYEVVMVLNTLIRENHVSIYDDGSSFV